MRNYFLLCRSTTSLSAFYWSLVLINSITFIFLNAVRMSRLEGNWWLFKRVIMDPTCSSKLMKSWMI